MSPRARQIALERRRAHARLHRDRPRLAVELQHARPCGPCRAPPPPRARRAAAPRRRPRSCRRRTARPPASRARRAPARARSCSWSRGIDDRVGRALGLAGAQAHEIGVALAGGVQHPFGVVVADALGADDRAQRAASVCSPSARRRRAAPLPSATGGRGRSASADRLAQEVERVRRQRRRVGRVAPAPPAHRRRRRSRSATDPLQAVERLVDRRRGGAAHHVAAEARRRRRSSDLAQLDRHLRRSVGASPRRRRRREPHLGLRRLSTRANGVPSTRCSQLQTRARPRRASTTLKSARTSLPLLVLITSVNASSVDVLDARHARPPARQVVGVADHLPQLLRGRGDRAAAARGGHGSPA